MSQSHVIELVRVRRMARDGEARRLRMRSGLSLAEVADAIGVSVGAVSRWENGQRKPTGSRALDYAHLLDQLQREGPQQ